MRTLINFVYRQSYSEERLLTPLTDPEKMGGLVPVSPLDNALDDMLVSLPSLPSYMEVSFDRTCSEDQGSECEVLKFIIFLSKDSEVTEAAIEATEPMVNSHAEEADMNVEALRVRLLALNEVLEQAREESITNKLQLARFQRQQ